MIKRMTASFSLDLFKKHPKSFLLIWALLFLGPAAGLAYIIFIFLGSFTIIDLHLSEKKALLLDTFLSILFFLQHSTLIRRGTRQRLTQFIPKEYYNAFYGITSSIALLLVMILWQKSPSIIITADGLVFWTLRGLFCLSLAGFFWGVRSLGSFDALGVRPIVRYINKRRDKAQPLAIKGPYRWVRHPLYLFNVILLWSCPVVTLDRLLFNILWCCWIIIATILEDRDLLQEFGHHYRTYRSEVPMLIPYRIPRRSA